MTDYRSFLLVLGFSVAACSSPGVTKDSNGDCTASLRSVSEGAAQTKDSAAFAQAILQITGTTAFSSIGSAMSSSFANAFNKNRPATTLPAPDSSDLSFALCAALEGQTAKTIIANRDSLGARAALQLGQRMNTVHVQVLEDARKASLAIRDSLAGFRVESARLLQDDGFMSLTATIVLRVTNSTNHTISRAHFIGRAVTEGRQVAWIEDEFNYQIPGGLAPGESATWRLQPNMFSGDWTSVRVPAQARFEVRATKLNDHEGESLWGGASFTRGDQKLLDSLRKTARF